MGLKRRCLGLAAAGFLLGPALAPAQIPGDVDCDSLVTSLDVALLGATVFGADSVPVATGCPGPDANGDDAVTAADIASVVSAIRWAQGPPPAFFGLAAADGTVLTPVAHTENGIPIFQRRSGSGFQLVVEAVPGNSGNAVGMNVFNSRPDNPQARPDLEMQSSRPLGDGNPGVCTEGGVRGFVPADFSLVQEVADALNDFACIARATGNPANACTVNSFGSPTFVSRADRVTQFCIPLSAERAFPGGDSVVTVRVKDVSGNPGARGELVVRVDAAPAATFTATPGPRPTHTPSPPSTPTADTRHTPTPTWTIAGRTQTPTWTVAGPTHTPTRTSSATATQVATTTPTRTRTPSPTVTGTRPPTPTPTWTRTATATLSPTKSHTPSRTPSRTATATPTNSHTPSATATVTSTPTVTRTPSRTRSPTRTATPTKSYTPSATATVTSTPTVTRTPTPTVPPEPVLTYFGVARADGTVVPPIGTTDAGVPIYERFFGSGFSLVVEGRPGGTNAPMGFSTFNWNPTDPTVLPDLQIQVNRPLGEDPTEAVCDDGGTGPEPAGVPAIDPPDFSEMQVVADRVNDLACRFKDGSGSRRGRDARDACTEASDGLFRFVDPTSRVQFCGEINIPARFPDGDTLVTARVRDEDGNLSDPAQIVLRVSPLAAGP